jgi:hypothetical protein
MLNNFKNPEAKLSGFLVTFHIKDKYQDENVEISFQAAIVSYLPLRVNISPSARRIEIL